QILLQPGMKASGNWVIAFAAAHPPLDQVPEFVAGLSGATAVFAPVLLLLFAVINAWRVIRQVRARAGIQSNWRRV
ncbi:MAG TPA: hypothetical protein VF720_05760, partial [Candidatus Eisenbacteria bacterium]